MQKSMKCSLLTAWFSLVGCQDIARTEGHSSQTTLSSDTVIVGDEPDWARESKLADIPDNVTGLVFLRRNDLNVHLSKNGQYTYQSQHMKLLDARALEVGNVTLSWNPEAGHPIVHKILIHRGSETINVLENNKFEVIRREDQLEFSMLNGFLTAILQIPDLRVGDELEWAFTVPSHDPTTKTDNSGLMTLGVAPFEGNHKLGISWEEGQKPSLQLSSDFDGLEHHTEDSISIELENPEMLSLKKDAPPRYNWRRIIEYSDYKNWAEISKHYNDLYSKALKLDANSSIKQEVKRIASTHSNELAQTKAALKLVQEQVRYIYVGLDGGNIKPATAEETWSRRYGDCKGKSVLLLTILKELGVSAELVLVNNTGNDSDFDERLPNPALFDHILIRAKINDEHYWLDPTLPSVIEPSKNPFMRYRSVLPLSSQGHNLETLPQETFALPQTIGLAEIDARSGFDQPARKVNTYISRGLEGLAHYMQYSAMTSEQLKLAFSNSLTGTTEWDIVENVSNKYNSDTQANILTIIGKGPVNWDNQGNGAYALALPGGGFIPPTRRRRDNDKNDNVPFYSAYEYTCHVTTVRLPETTKLGGWGFNSTYLNEIFGQTYYRMMERRDDNTIRMIRSSRVETPEITAEQALQDNARIAAFDNSKAIIEYSPNQFKAFMWSKHPVPSTYEIDWSKATAPCLPEKTKQENTE